MLGLTCNACNKEFEDDSDQKLHYKSEWHRYNLKHKVAGVPGVTEALFLAKHVALVQEKESGGSKSLVSAHVVRLVEGPHFMKNSSIMAEAGDI